MKYFFLQETCSDIGLEDVWRAEWVRKIFAYGSKHSKGVMALFRPSLSTQVSNTSVDKSGRFFIVSTTINGDEFCLVTLYGILFMVGHHIVSQPYSHPDIP